MSTDINNLIADLSVDQLLALQKALTEQKADLMEKVRADLAVHLKDTVDTIVAENLVTESRSSAWVGASVSGIKVKSGDTEFTVSVRVTDTTRTEAREKDFPKKGKEKATAKAAA